MGHSIKFGNNISINLEPDSREEAERLFKALSAGGKVGMELAEMFWGGYFGSITDKFGVQWMFNYQPPAENS
jgi:PhnB protein